MAELCELKTSLLTVRLYATVALMTVLHVPGSYFSAHGKKQSWGKEGNGIEVFLITASLLPMSIL